MLTVEPNSNTLSNGEPVSIGNSYNSVNGVSVADGWVSASVLPGRWFFVETIVPSESRLLVEMERGSGDPILFVKLVDDAKALILNGLPTLYDYQVSSQRGLCK